MLGGVDLILVDKIVNEVKSQGVFDQFRKDSMADVDTKPAYQNLRQRVESSVGKFLADQKWKSDLNKFQLREKLRKHIVDAGFLDTGVERIVDQVVNPKISTVFQPKIEDIAYNYLGIEKPHVSPKSILNGSLDIKTDLLPTDLEAVSPDSDKTKSETKEDVNELFEDKNEEFESPPFEPLETMPTSNPIKKEESDNSQLSGISGLTSQDSVTSEHKEPTPTPKFPVSGDTQAESDLSEVSSNSRLSIVTNDENSEASKPLLNKPADVDMSEEAQMPKFSENSGETKVGQDLHFDIKREDIKFEGTERKTDPNMYSFAHQNENDTKTQQSNDIKVETKSEVDSDAHTYSDNVCVKTEKDSDEASKVTNIEQEKIECSAVDMSLSESESTRDSDSSSTFKNRQNSDLQSNESRSCIYRPRPPSPPNDYMLQKPPSPKYYMMPIPPPPPTPPLPPPPVDDSYDRPPPPPPPGTTTLPPKPPSPIMPPLPPMPPSPTPPGEETPLPYIPLPAEVAHQRKPSSPPPLPPECSSLEGVQSLSSSNEGLLSIVSSHSSSVEFAFPIAPPPPPPPREELPTPQEEKQAMEKDNDSLPVKESKPPLPPPPPLPSSPDDQLINSNATLQSEKMEADYSGTNSHKEDKTPSLPSPKHELQSSSSTYRPPSPKYIHSSPERSHTKDNDRSPKYRSTYSQFDRDPSSPIHDDYINSPSPPPYEELRPNSPTSFDLKSISSKETSFSLSETSQNDSLSKPPSPFSPKKKSSSSKQETPNAPTPPLHKSKHDTKCQSDSAALKPPSPPAQSKSASKSEHRSSKSSSQHSHHKSSKSSRDDKTVHHSHRSSSSSSRHHTPSSTHRSSDDRKHSGSSSSKHKSSKSESRSKDRERDKDKDKDKNKKKDDHSSARHKEKRRKSTDSNDDDHHKQGSKHSSSSGGSSRNTQEKPTQSGRTKEPPSNSNSSGNLSSSNSNSCNSASQRASTSTRTESQKKLGRSSSKEEETEYLFATEEERNETSDRLNQLADAIKRLAKPIYLFDCDESMQNQLRELFSNVVNIETEPPTSGTNKFEYKTIYLNCENPPVNPAKHSLVKEAIMNNNTSNQKLMKNVSRKRKMESPHVRKSPKNVSLEAENCLIIDCIEYDKPEKHSRLDAEHRADVSPTSSDMSVSSKENEFIGGKVKKSAAKSMRNGKFIKAEGIVRIENSSNNGFKLNSQRYSSEDLYKPRPLSQRPRRREQVSEAEL